MGTSRPQSSGLGVEPGRRWALKREVIDLAMKSSVSILQYLDSNLKERKKKWPLYLLVVLGSCESAGLGCHEQADDRVQSCIFPEFRV